MTSDKICKYCGEEFNNIMPLDLARHVKSCPKKPKVNKKIAFPDVTVCGIREKWLPRPIKMIRKNGRTLRSHHGRAQGAGFRLTVSIFHDNHVLW
jgi:hypothetical protein